MKLDLSKKIVEFLKQHQEQKFTARQIAEWVFKTYPEECMAKRERSKNATRALEDDHALVQQIISEIGAGRQRMQRHNHHLKTTEERPRKYYYTNQSDDDEIQQAESTRSISADSIMRKYSEHDLYPMLSSFLWAEFNIYSKRIDEKRSSNNRGMNGNKWLYPDVVAMEDLTSEWDQKIRECAKQHADKKTKLWSFEVKRLINRSNVRETFFQAVSNSSWANFGYLVAAELEGTDTKRELQILSELHGIGFILLDATSPTESQVLIPAKENHEIDWNTANRLIEESTDFKNFIEEVTSFYQTGKTKNSDWDIIDI
jgi:uncharacterized protein